MANCVFGNQAVHTWEITFCHELGPLTVPKVKLVHV